jgi:hypothetical protein
MVGNYVLLCRTEYLVAYTRIGVSCTPYALIHTVYLNFHVCYIFTERKLFYTLYFIQLILIVLIRMYDI